MRRRNMVRNCLNCGEVLINGDFRTPHTKKYCRPCAVLIKRERYEKQVYNKRLKNLEDLMQQAIKILQEERK